MKIYTTQSISSGEITEHLGMVSAHFIIGANIFRDLFAGISDALGGQNKGYKKVLNDLELAAMDELKAKTKKLGGNAIVGLIIDQDELSGGGKSMFMIKAYGTAVNIEYHSTDSQQDQEISIEYFENAYSHLIKKEKLKQNNFALEDVLDLGVDTFQNKESKSLFFEGIGAQNIDLGAQGNERLDKLTRQLGAFSPKEYDGLLWNYLGEEEKGIFIQMVNLGIYYEVISYFPLGLLKKAVNENDHIRFIELAHLVTSLNPFFYSSGYMQNVLGFLSFVEEKTELIDEITHKECAFCEKTNLSEKTCKSCGKSLPDANYILQHFNKERRVFEFLLESVKG
jgi:uncharacterized protein YbjQ (UPF0145 family)